MQPARSSSKASEKRVSAVRRWTILVPAALAWILFFYWWRRVALESTPWAAKIAVCVLILVTVTIFYLMLGWIRHNLKLAARGKRGLATRYLRPIFSRDWLDRLLVFRSRVPLRGRWFVIHDAKDEKRYSPQSGVKPGPPPPSPPA